MNSFETASTYNPRGVNGSAYELTGTPLGMQGPWQQNVSQIPFAGQQPAWPAVSWTQPQQAFFQPQGFHQPQPFLQSQPPYQQPFIHGLGQHPFLGAQGIQSFGTPWHAYQTPWQAQFAGSPYTQMPYAGYGQQVVTTRSAELNIKLPLHRLIGRHPQEVQQYLLFAVLPVLVDGVIKRSFHPEPGRTLSSDVRGECVAEIAI